MNIAILYSSDTQKGIIEGLRKSGHFIISYNYADFTKSYCLRFLSGLNKRLIRIGDKHSFNKNLLKVLKNDNYHPLDLILILKGHKLNRKSELALKDCNFNKLQWTIDTVERWPGQASLFSQMDMVFFQDGSDISLHPKGVWLPLGFDASLFTYNPKKEIDILLIGNVELPFYLKRRQCFINIAPLAKKGYKVVYAGNLPYRDKELQRIFLVNGVKIFKRLPLNKYADLIGKSRICVNIHQDDGGMAINPMFFAIPASGGLQLTDDYEYLQNWLEPYIYYYTTSPETIHDDIQPLLSSACLSYELANGVSLRHSYFARGEFIISSCLQL